MKIHSSPRARSLVSGIAQVAVTPGRGFVRSSMSTSEASADSGDPPGGEAAPTIAGEDATTAASAADPFGADPFGGTFSHAADADETAVAAAGRDVGSTFDTSGGGFGTTSTAEATESFDFMRSPERPVFDAFTTPAAAGDEPADGTSADPFAPAPAPAPETAEAAIFDFGADPFASAPAPTPAGDAPASTPAALFDFGDFPAPAEAPSPAATTAPAAAGALLDFSDFSDFLEPAPSPAGAAPASPPAAGLLPGFDDFAPAPAPAAPADAVSLPGLLALDEPEEPPSKAEATAAARAEIAAAEAADASLQGLAPGAAKAEAVAAAHAELADAAAGAAAAGSEAFNDLGFKAEYDYEQHLKPMGAEGGKFVAAPGADA